MTLAIEAIAFDRAGEALEHLATGGHGQAILLDGRYLVVGRADVDRLAAGRVAFAYLCSHELPDGSQRFVAIPVNG